MATTRNEKIARDYRAGVLVNEIAAVYGCSNKTVFRVAVQKGLKLRGRGRPKWPDSTNLEFIKRHYGVDKSAREIAEVLGISRNAVIGAANRHLVP